MKPQAKDRPTLVVEHLAISGTLEKMKILAWLDTLNFLTSLNKGWHTNTSLLFLEVKSKLLLCLKTFIVELKTGL